VRESATVQQDSFLPERPLGWALGALALALLVALASLWLPAREPLATALAWARAAHACDEGAARATFTAAAWDPGGAALYRSLCAGRQAWVYAPGPRGQHLHYVLLELEPTGALGPASERNLHYLRLAPSGDAWRIESSSAHAPAFVAPAAPQP